MIERRDIEPTVLPHNELIPWHEGGQDRCESCFAHLHDVGTHYGSFRVAYAFQNRFDHRWREHLLAEVLSDRRSNLAMSAQFCHAVKGTSETTYAMAPVSGVRGTLARVGLS